MIINTAVVYFMQRFSKTTCLTVEIYVSSHVFHYMSNKRKIKGII